MGHAPKSENVTSVETLLPWPERDRGRVRWEKAAGLSELLQAENRRIKPVSHKTTEGYLRWQQGF